MGGTDRQTQPKAGTTDGKPPPSAEHTEGPGVTNGVPDGAAGADAIGSPSSDRKDTETAGGSGG